MTKQVQTAIRKGNYIRALVLAGYDINLRDDRLIGIRNNRSSMFEGAFRTAKEACDALRLEPA